MLMSVILGKKERPKGAAVEDTGVGKKQNESESLRNRLCAPKEITNRASGMII